MNSAVCLCIILSLLSGLRATAYKLVTEPPKCCKPVLFQATATVMHSNSSRVLKRMQTFVDYQRQIQVNKVFRQDRNEGETTFISRVVMDFAQGWMFEFPDQSSKCNKLSLSTLMSLRCVPDGATYIGSDYIAPEGTLVDTWTIDQRDNSVTFTFAFTRDDCMPVFLVQKGKLWPENILVDMTTLYTNVSTTVDMSVFDYPNNCVLSNKPVGLGYRRWGPIPSNY